MTIDRDTLALLIRIFKNHITKPAGDLPLTDDEIGQALQFIETISPGRLNLDDLYEPEEGAALDLPHQKILTILNQSFKTAEGQIVFNPIGTKIALDHADAAYLALAETDAKKIGIQEKYLKSQLTAKEYLTELDIKRCLAHTALLEHVHVSDLSAQKIGLILHAARLNHRDNAPYSITLMLDTTPEEEHGYPSWLSLHITVNPQTNALEYGINPGKRLTDSERASIIAIIEQGLQFNRPIDGIMYSAFPNATLSQGPIPAASAQINAKAASYKVLQDIYKHPAFADRIQVETRAAAIKTCSSTSIQHEVYQLELETIEIPQHILEAAPPTLAPHILTGIEREGHRQRQLKQSVIDRQLRQLGTPAPVIPAQHPLVNSAYGQLRLYNKKFTFPDQRPTTPLNGVDYEQFLLLAHKKFKTDLANITLDEMTMMCDSISALQGLIAFNETRTPLPFKTLTLDLEHLPAFADTNAEELFLFHLKTMLLSMSDASLPILDIKDNNHRLSEDLLNKLKEFIESREIAIDINLPKEHSALQKTIDKLTPGFIRQRQIASLGKRVPTAPQDTPAAQENRRQRPKPMGELSLSVDVELQQEQQTEVSQERASSNSTETPEESYAEAWDVTGLQQALEHGELNHVDGFLFNSQLREVIELWANWVGALSMRELNLTNSVRLSKAACEELLRHHQQFAFGIDLQRLPAGFMLKTQGQRSFIHFDPSFKQAASYDPLQVQTHGFAAEKPFDEALVTKALDTFGAAHPINLAWSRLNEMAIYDKKTHQLFIQYLPKMFNLSEAQLVSLFELSQDANGQLAINKLAFLCNHSSRIKGLLSADPRPEHITPFLTGLFGEQYQPAIDFILNYTESNHAFEDHLLYRLSDEADRDIINDLIRRMPGINLNALLQLYTQFGIEGIKQFSTLTQADSDRALFQQLLSTAWSKTKTYAPVLTQEYKEAIATIRAFSEIERQWWDTLLEQHCHAHDDVNLIDLVNAFKVFKMKLAQIKLPEGMGSLAIRTRCECHNVDNMPVALSRILTLLTQVREEDRQAQWDAVSGLDLSSAGMIKAISSSDEGKLWAFITPEMNIIPETERQRGDDSDGSVMFNFNTAANPPESWQHIGQLNTPVTEDFFRYVAYQKRKAQMPLSFYKDAHRAISTNNASPSIKQKLYQLIAAASTGEKTVSVIGSAARAREDFEGCIRLINGFQMPGAKEQLLDNLCGLAEIPPLPILHKLIRVINSSLSGLNLLNLAQLQRLQIANQQLQARSADYKDLIYEGMKDYTDADYNNGQLFFNHMTVINTIHERLHARQNTEAQNLIALLSSFQLNEGNIAQLIEEHFPNQPDVAAVTEPDPAAIIEPAAAAQETLEERKQYALLLLKKLSLNEHPTLRRLEATDLHTILRAVRDEPGRRVQDIFRGLELRQNEPLSAYFPEHYLEYIGHAEIPPAVNDKLTQYFNEPEKNQLTELFKHFSAPGDTEQYGALVDQLILITNPLSPLEKRSFIQKLSHSAGLFATPEPLSDANNAFVKLINFMANNGVHGFLNLIAAEQQLTKKQTANPDNECFITRESTKFVQHLDKKTLLFLDTLQPLIKKTKDLRISQIDLQPRLIETLFKTPPAQLTAVSAVESELLPYFVTYEGALHSISSAITKGEQIDIPLAKETTTTFIESNAVDNTRLFSDYKARLDQIEDTGIHGQDLLTICENPEFLTLMRYLQDPASITDPQLRAQLDTKFAGIYQRHPSLMTNRVFIPFLTKNRQFRPELNQDKVMRAASSSQLLSEDVSLEILFDALDKDLEGIKTFSDQTRLVEEELARKKMALNQYPSVFAHVFKTMNQMAIDNPGCQQHILALYDHYLDAYTPTTDGELLNYLSDFVKGLEQSFKKISDKNIVLSLCFQFSDPSSALKPKDLIALLQLIDSLPAERQLGILKIAVALISNQKGYTFESFAQLCQSIRDENFANAVIPMYEKAPFPTVTQVQEWHRAALEGNSYVADMQTTYRAYSKAPCARQEMNGFKIADANRQLQTFKVDGVIGRRDWIDPDAFHQKTIAMRDLDTEELLSRFKRFNPSHAEAYPSPIDEDELVAIAAELFHRAQGVDAIPGNPGIRGDSMEINTTQYLAILSSLKTPGHVTSEIGTGEGKTRIMMISIACQFALGHTVDFVTSDAALATRDFVAHQPYFDLLDAKTSMIFAQTDPSLYQQGGINFSDPSNLSLFRNKARSLGQGHLVIDPVPTNRALLLDEADKTFFDVADTRFNFSKEGEEHIRGMEWVYPLLMQYFALETIELRPEERARLTPIDPNQSYSPLAIYFDNIDFSRERFLNYARNVLSNDADFNRLRSLANEQIEQWQVSAVTASQLKFGKDFVIEPDTLINTPAGPRISSEAQLLFSNRVAKGSKYSFGIHQCLHARLNLEREKISAVMDPKLRDALTACEQPFYVAEEKQIVYSSTSKNLLDDYRAGTLKAVTGTSGSALEREEARALYGIPGDTAAQPMHFVDVPRHKTKQRIDRAMRLTANAEQQFKALVEQVTWAIKKNQPILIIAESDKESEDLFNRLSAVFRHSPIQRIHSQLSKKQEDDSIHQAGEPRQITISTGMIGRGTDIKLGEESKQYGLNVMLTYLPRQRDLQQIIGRSGRDGQRGETSIILDKQRLKRALGKGTLTDGYYKEAETYILAQQALMDRRSQCERLIKGTLGDFKKALTDQFFERMLPHVDPASHGTLMPHWTKFVEISDKAWNEKWPYIQQKLQKQPIDMGAINTRLTEYQMTVQQSWNKLRLNLTNEEVTCVDGSSPLSHLSAGVPSLVLDATTQNLLQSSHGLEPLTASIYNRYDPGHEGRAVQYSHWTIPVLASLKGYVNLFLPQGFQFEEARRPFANTRAWLEGHGRLFPNLRASGYQWTTFGMVGMGLLGTMVGTALVATGILAPIGLSLLGLSVLATNAIVMGTAGLGIGMITGAVAGVITDTILQPKKIIHQPAAAHVPLVGANPSGPAVPSSDQRMIPTLRAIPPHEPVRPAEEIDRQAQSVKDSPVPPPDQGMETPTTRPGGR